MCGVTGFFTGCQLAGNCSKAKAGGCKMKFSSSDAFNKWHEKSSVRSAPRRMLDCDDTSLDLFPRELVPVVSHNLFQTKYPDRVSEFLCLQLYRYLDFTTNLELLVVNPNLLTISLAADEFELSESDILSIHKMYVDEGYHALFCIDIAQQLGGITNIRPQYKQEPSFLTLLRQFKNEADDPKLVELIFTSVSETLITGSLVNVARDGTAPDAVNQIMLDHSRDEGRHHLFFKDFIRRLNKMGRGKFEKALELIPNMIMAFIDPDRPQLMQSMLQVGIREEDARQIIAETYTDEIVNEYARESSKALFKFLDEEDIGMGTPLYDAAHTKNLIGHAI